MRVEVNHVIRKKETKLGAWKKIVRYFKSKQRELEKLDDYNLPKLFNIEKVYPKLKDEKLRLVQTYLVFQRVKIFSKDGWLNIQIFR